MSQEMCDLVIVGGGIAGLAAAINAASEGLSVTVLEGGNEFGGQTTTIKEIRNLVGYPEGISGRDLIQRTLAQARGFGVVLRAPYRVQSINRHESGEFSVHSSHNTTLHTRAVLITAGVRYRRLGVDSVSSFLGYGVTYGELPDTIRYNGVVYIVGGGNSAGQAAIALAKKNAGCAISLLIRGKLSDGHMSHYLREAIEGNDRFGVWENHEILEAEGFLTLERLVIRDTISNTVKTVPLHQLLIAVGAEPHVEWAHNMIEVDTAGYIKTGNGLPFESTPGIFAAGDVESGSVKRVASAIGAATGAVASITKYLGRR